MMGKLETVRRLIRAVGFVGYVKFGLILSTNFRVLEFEGNLDMVGS